MEWTRLWIEGAVGRRMGNRLLSSARCESDQAPRKWVIAPFDSQGEAHARFAIWSCSSTHFSPSHNPPLPGEVILELS